MVKSRKTNRKQKRRLTNKRRKQRGGDPKVIMRHITDFQASKTHPGIFYSINELNVEKDNRVCIIGPTYPGQDEEDITTITYPYEGCLFFFDMHFPPRYPEVSPNLQFMNSFFFADNFRYHPNLYQGFGDKASSGKVCLSILGTWAGPGWQPTMNIESTLTTVQSLLGPTPIHNEPSYETLAKNDKRAVSYNHAVFYRSVKFTIDVYKMIVERDEATLPVNIQVFVDELKENMFTSIKFLVGKLAKIKARFPDGYQTIAELHHSPTKLDYTQLYDEVFGFFASMPDELKVELASENTSVQAERNKINREREIRLRMAGINTRSAKVQAEEEERRLKWQQQEQEQIAMLKAQEEQEEQQKKKGITSANINRQAKELNQEANAYTTQANMYAEERDKREEIS